MSNIDSVDLLTMLMTCVAAFFIIRNMHKKNKEITRQGEMKIRDRNRKLVEQFQAVRKAAEQGDATAQAKLGFAYYSGGDYLPKDDKEAHKYFMEVAEHGFLQGWGTGRSRKRKQRWPG